MKFFRLNALVCLRFHKEQLPVWWYAVSPSTDRRFSLDECSREYLIIIRFRWSREWNVAKLKGDVLGSLLITSSNRQLRFQGHIYFHRSDSNCWHCAAFYDILLIHHSSFYSAASVSVILFVCTKNKIDVVLYLKLYLYAVCLVRRVTDQPGMIQVQSLTNKNYISLVFVMRRNNL